MARSWWTTPEEPNIALGVVGFGIAAPLGAKISTVNACIHAIEDAVCRLFGSMKDMWSARRINMDLLTWSIRLEKFITGANPRSSRSLPI